MSSDDTFAAGLDLSAAWIGRNFSVKLKIEIISIFYYHRNGGLSKIYRSVCVFNQLRAPNIQGMQGGASSRPLCMSSSLQIFCRKGHGQHSHYHHHNDYLHRHKGRLPEKRLFLDALASLELGLSFLPILFLG